MRGATSAPTSNSNGPTDFNPRSSCEERLGLLEQHRGRLVISIHAPHARSDRLALQPYARLEISIHAPHARSDCAEICIIDDTIISIHAPHARSDSPYPSHLVPPARKFQSTLLMRGATRRFHQLLVRAILFQSTLLMRGATGSPSSMAGGTRNFNPRSSCEERPSARRPISCGQSHFNPRSSCEERRCSRRSAPPSPNFNPRSSCEERPSWPRGVPGHHYFNPRSSCEERLSFAKESKAILEISIHAPHARSDVFFLFCFGGYREISIHAPHARSDTHGWHEGLHVHDISIHAPHARSDDSDKSMRSSGLLFQSTLLMRGATRYNLDEVQMAIVFQSTLLMRGATQLSDMLESIGYISIHAPHARSDGMRDPEQAGHRKDFNPRSSCEERQHNSPYTISDSYFNPRSSCEERRPNKVLVALRIKAFQSTLLMRGATHAGAL